MNRAARAGAHLMLRGHTPFVPHLAHVIDRVALGIGMTFSWEEWMEWCKVWLRECDAFLFLGTSKGADIELALAKELGLPIYTHPSQLPLGGVAADKVPSNGRLVPASRNADLQVDIVRLPHACEELPAYQTDGAAAMDLRAAIPEWPEKYFIYPQEVLMISTGICVAIPSGYAGFVLPRSGLATKHRIRLANSPGLIDSDFRGELLLSLTNEGPGPFSICRGDRLAQLMIVPVTRAVWHEAEQLPPTERGRGGWGSTGVAE